MLTFAFMSIIYIYNIIKYLQAQPREREIGRCTCIVH